MEVIHLKDIHKAYRDTGFVPVFEGLNLSVYEGEIIGITGPSGSGKTTLMNIVGLIDKPDSGFVYLLGEETSGWDEKRSASFRNSSIGFIFQYHYLIPELSALENVCIPLLIEKRQISESEREKCMSILEYVGLKDKVDNFPSELSGGERQRVAVARAIVNDPAIILADEPTGSLDKDNKLRIVELLRSIRDRYGTTILIATHDFSLLEFMDRVFRIENRRLVEVE